VSGLLTLDLVVAVLAAGAWLGAGATAAMAPGPADPPRRPWLVMALVALAVLAAAGRVVTVVLLLRVGWWFAAEKVILGLPLLFGGGIAALVLLGTPGRPARPARIGPRGVLALFGAGYAAAAGPVVTLLGGYPVTWSVGLVTVALVIGATVATARVLGRSRLRAPAVAAFTTALLGVALAVVTTSTVDTGGGTADRLGPTTMVTDLRGPDTPAPGGVVRRFTLTARTATVDTAGGRRVSAWTFNGQVPGPAITANQGDLIEVTLVNADISAGVTLHWHGYDVPAAQDGAPGLTQDAVQPGQRFVYRFRADQTGTYWYHTHEASDTGVKLGLFGSLVVSPRPATTGAPSGEELDLTVPLHTVAGVLTAGEHGAPADRTVAPGTPVRLRLINTDDVPRVLELAGTPFRVVAVDGTDLHSPGELRRTGVRVPAGGRYDLAFTMPATTVHLGLSTGDGLTFVPTGPAAPPAAMPTEGRPLLDLLSYGTPAATAIEAGRRADRRFTLVLDRGLGLAGGRPSYGYTVNGRAFPQVPTEVVRAGDLVEFTIVNRSRDIHPWHLHGHHVLVLARDGREPTGSPLWLDTFDVRPGEVWRVVFRADNPGVWMNHCHNLAHADQGMVLHLAYAGYATPFHGGHGNG